MANVLKNSVHRKNSENVDANVQHHDMFFVQFPTQMTIIALK